VLAVTSSGLAQSKTHTVRSGESLWGIAHQHHVTVKAVRALNGLGEGDSIRPGQVLKIPRPGAKIDDPKPKPEVPEAEAPKPKSWVLAKPSAETQTQKTPEQRGGINPCLSPDPGFGIYDRWSRAPNLGQMIAPGRGGITKSGSFDVMFHFHGHEPARKEWVRVMDGAVLVGIDLGIGSGPYAAAFGAPGAFEQLVHSVEAAMAKKHGLKQARARKIGLSSWSAGYGAVGEIISQPYGQRVVDVVILLDGLHSGYEADGLNRAQLAPFVRYAREARDRRRFMFVSHSSIIPPGYASTTETANYLISELGGRPRRGGPRGSGPWGMDLISRYSAGNFHVRGYAGNDKMDHCAHIGLYRDVLKVHVRPRWKSPRGSAAKN
jgi:murein DD-endopeptidase MepM/ murein hydrolase activator NlpD